MKTLNRIFIRSFMVQAAWNYEIMQGLGYLYSFYPRLEELYEDPQELAAACLRHLNYFNTHPYMVSFVLGENARMEDKKEPVCTPSSDISTRFKLQMGGPLAALGDKLFWSTWRPLAGLIAVLGVYIWKWFGEPVQLGWIIPVGFIILYNAPVVYFRYRGLSSSYYGRSDLADIIRRVNSNFWVSILPALGLSAVALSHAVVFIRDGLIRGALLLGTTILVIFLRKRLKVTSTALLYLVALSVLIGSLFLL